MATRNFEIAEGDSVRDVTEAVGSPITAGKLVSVTIDLATPVRTGEIASALDAIKLKILAGDWPPA